MLERVELCLQCRQCSAIGRYAEQGYTMNRTINLLNAFGFQGGTIHQLAEITDCKVNDLLYTAEEKWGIDYTEGWFAYRTNSKEFNQRFTESEKGNLQFWLGVAQGVETTRKQGLSVVAKF